MADADPLIGRQLASFRLDRVLGRGGMATVYYGWDVKLDRPVAVKLIDARYQGDPAYAERFVNEARVIATWRHQNILQVYYADDDHGLYYYVMEFVPGHDLSAVLAQAHAQSRRLPALEVMRLGRAVASALDYAHARGVIHRDVKPANIMVADDGRVVLTDFGLALNVAQGTQGTIFGSPHYFAPEQARNSAEVVPQSDLYSLGIVLYEMLAGRVPFDDPAPLTLAMLHLQQAPPPLRQFNPDLSPAVEAVVLKALSKAPADRYQTGQALMDALAEALDVPEPTLAFLAPLPPGRVNQQATQPPPAPPLGQRLRRHPAYIYLARELPKFLQRVRRHPAYVYLARDLAAVGAVLRQRPWTAATAQQLRPHPAAWLGAGVIVLVVLAPLLGLANMLSGRDTPDQAEANGTASATDASPTDASPADPTLAASEPSAVPATAAAVDGAAPPAGDHFALYYDDTSLYFHNLSANDRSINPLALERLTADGQPANRWDGERWGEIYSNFRAGYCAVVELIDYRDHFAPPECNNRKVVQRTPFAADPGIFWTTQEGSTQFRVLWNDAEVGRCDIAAHRCDIYLP